MAEKRVLAFDYGASSGRGIVGSFDGKKLSLQEVHRFSNDPVIVNGTMYWDTLRLFFELKQGLIRAKHAGGFDSIGIDTWGVDFGLLDRHGALIGNPVHYRDARTNGMCEKSFSLIDKETFYQITGNQFMDINTAFQLLALKERQPDVLERAETLLFTPDLLNYFLTGIKKAEYSIASTSQLLDARERCWSKQVIEALGLPERIFPEIVPSGTRLGPVTPEICEELGLENVDVVAICGHDTQDALVSVPTKEKDFIFISCGTWSLFGTELDSPVIDANSARLNITNEGGYAGRISFLKNIIGLWLIQESRRQWIREGREYGFGTLEKMASAEPAFRCFIDPDAPEFVPAGNIPRRIREYCERTGQPVPENEGQIVRCINESLAFKYRDTLAEIETCTGKDYRTIYLVGGGTQSALLCQMTASACHKRVSAGPVEATVYGNLALQLMAAGEIASIEEARDIIQASPDIRSYEPQDAAQWEDAYVRYLEVTRRA
ncbi:MAG: rhamnulokinase family protein [Eubacteriales bacterium]|nr:rhamnulokinase family protein [Eubacteriales bacterium]